MRDLLLRIPNLPARRAPDGAGEADNVVLRTDGLRPRGLRRRTSGCRTGTSAPSSASSTSSGRAKIAGSMFTMYRGWGARLLRALVQLSLDRNADAYEEIRPPTLVRTETMIATGHLPKFADDAYHIERDDLWAIPTAEVPLTSLAPRRDPRRGRPAAALHGATRRASVARPAPPGATPAACCGSHEFDKVELLALRRRRRAGHRLPGGHAGPQRGDPHRTSACAYRVLDLCTGDLGASAARTWDIEVYAPGCDQWLEVSSVSWFSDYQARRANIRYRPTAGKGTEICHTVNGSAMGWPRTVAAYLETHRQPDGSVAVVECLRPYLGGVSSVPR